MPRQPQSHRDKTASHRRHVSRGTEPGSAQPPSERAVGGELERLEALVRELRAENVRLARVAASADAENRVRESEMADITARKQADEALRQATRRFQTIVDHAPIAIYVKDRDGRFVFGNNGLERYTGRRLDALLGKTDYDFASREDADRWRQNDLEVLGGKRVTKVEETGTDAQGRPYVNLSVKFALTDASGVPVEVCGISTDITDRKRAEEALRESEERFRAICEQGAIGIALGDVRGRLTFVNRALEKMLGYEEGELIGRDFRDLTLDDDRSAEEAYVEELVTGQRDHYGIEKRYLRKDGQSIWVALSGSVLRDSTGRPAFGLVMVHDISERKRAEAALLESERRERERAAELQTILDTAPIGIAIASDASGEHIRGNRANEDMFGLPPGAELSKAGPRAARFRPLQAGRELAPVELPMQRAIRGEIVREQVFDVVREDGQTLAVYAKATPLFDEGGRPRGAVGAFLDITALKQAEQSLQQANAALAEADRRKDEFLAVLSHELRNPLAPIRYALPLLAEERLGAAGRRATEVIDRQVAHLSRLVDDLLDVSRITAGKIELRRDHVALGSVVTAAVEAASPAIAAGRHSLDISVPEAPVWLHVDAARISQAITNLLNNSAKYTPQGGRIRLDATADETVVTVRVIDNGIGLAREALTTVFEMFRQATDRNSAEGGLGVGLTLAKQLVEMHGGSIEAHSEGPGQGAEFVIRLPSAAVAAPGHEQEPPAPCEQPACLRVLVADDNVDLVDVLAMLVEAAGHHVRKAFDGRSAVSAALDYQPQLILLDVGMPDMNGMEVAKELRRHAALAGTRIVALTGWGQAEDRRRTADAGFDDHLTKPADPRQIRRVLDDVAKSVKA